MKRKKLGEVLRDRGKISSDDLELMIVEQQGKAIHLGELMLERGLVQKDDLASALKKNPRAAAFFEAIDKTNRYAILYRIQAAKKPETRAARIAKFVDMLARGEKLH